MDRVIHIAILTPIKFLGVHDYDKVGQHCHAPAELLSGHENLNGASLKQALDHCSFCWTEALVEET